jgi:hypothetical protein
MREQAFRVVPSKRPAFRNQWQRVADQREATGYSPGSATLGSKLAY